MVQILYTSADIPHVCIEKSVFTRLQQKLHLLVNISMFTNATNNFWSYVMNGLADVYGFKICIQVCVWLDFHPWNSTR